MENVKHVIAIASGKGGVGKSTVATNLACSLTRQGKKIGLLDLDIYGPSLPILLGLNEQPKMTEDNKLIPLDKFGMKVMSFGFISGNDTPVIWRGPLVSRMTEQFFRDVDWGELDILLLDWCHQQFYRTLISHWSYDKKHLHHQKTHQFFLCHLAY